MQNLIFDTKKDNEIMNKNKSNPLSHIGEIHGIYKIVDMLNEKDKYGHYIYVAECQECGHKRYSHYGGIAGKYKTIKCNHLTMDGRFVCSEKWGNDRIRKVFNGMRNRCYNKNNKSYKWYGAKGIKVYKEWLDNPKSFECWAIENGYSDNLTIDRIDENKDYCPENCRWISLENNAKYKSTTSIINVDGEKHTGRDWAKILGFGTNIINAYVRKYGLDNTIEFIKKYLKNPNLKPKNKQSYYDLYMN